MVLFFQSFQQKQSKTERITMKLAFDPFQFNLATQNSIPIHWKNIPWINGFVYLRLALTVGGRHDPVGQEGLAHFLEHLPFNGCAGYPTQTAVEEADRSIFQDTLGANTGFDRTMYHAKVATEKLVRGMDFLHHFLVSPLLDPKETERERGVITQEIWRAFESPQKEKLGRNLQKLKYGNHPFSRQKRVLGWHDSVEKITCSDLQRFHDTYYRSGNMRIILVGDVTQATLADLDKFTGSLPKGKSVEPPPNISSWPKPTVPELLVSVGDYYGVKGESLPKKTVLNIFAGMPRLENPRIPSVARSILRQLLFNRIRSTLGATYSPHVGVSTFSDHSSFHIDLEIAPDTLQAVREIISTSIAELASGDLQHQILFQELKITTRENNLYYDSSADDIADDAMEELIDTGSIKSLREDLENIDDVCYTDVAQFFSTHLQPDQLFWSIMTP
ncbi:MAG: zinc protease [Parcubacteria bacterium C7867-002]|nr:MAG: zinc protease [Parcubacteria bacterium C7867-002]